MANLTPISGLDDLIDLIDHLPGADEDVRKIHRAREATLTKPSGSLGRLERLSEHMAIWQAQHPPKTDLVTILVFAGNHGVTAQGVSAYPAEVTEQMVANFANGGAAINQMASSFAAELSVIPLELDKPTGDFTERPAMSENECVDAINAGIAAAHERIDLLAVGEMGIGNTTSASAIAAALYGGSAEQWVGPGTGVDVDGLGRKTSAIEKALERHPRARTCPLEALRCLGGREIAAMAGAILAGRMRRTPVLIDGLVATAAAAVLHALNPSALDHCIAAHRSTEPAHARLLDAMALDPLLDLGMRLGEASGAAMAIPFVRAAVACHNGMASFESARVSTAGNQIL